MILREENLSEFDDNKDLNLDELVNLEVLSLSHNKIDDLDGVGMCNTLIELNLNFNLITDITPIQDLTHLEKLHLSHNQITDIDVLKDF